MGVALVEKEKLKQKIGFKVLCHNLLVYDGHFVVKCTTFKCINRSSLGTCCTFGTNQFLMDKVRLLFTELKVKT